MTQEDIDTLINEAWMQGCEFGRMAEREKEKKRQRYDIHSCGPDCDRYICVAVRKAREEEREACAKLIESHMTGASELMDTTREMEAAAIRARGNT